MSDTRISYEDRSRLDLKASYRMASLIGVVMIISLFVYAAVVEFLKEEPSVVKSGMDADTLQIVRYVLLGITAALFFLIRFIRKMLLSASSPTAVPAGRLMTASIVVYALCESVAIYGLVLFFLGGDPMDFYTFMAISLFYFAVYFPRMGQWEEWVKAQELQGRGGKRQPG